MWYARRQRRHIKLRRPFVLVIVCSEYSDLSNASHRRRGASAAPSIPSHRRLPGPSRLPSLPHSPCLLQFNNVMCRHLIISMIWLIMLERAYV